MIKYKYIGGWDENSTFFTEGLIYEVESKDRKGNTVIMDNNYAEYGLGYEVSKDNLTAYFEEVVQ